MTRLYLMDEEQVSVSDRRTEADLRDKLEYYKDKRLLRDKFQRQLDEHLAKTGRSEAQIVETLQRMIAGRISNG